VSRTVLVAGGGTAGHVFPAIAVAHELRALGADVEPVFVGVADRLEARLVPEAGFELHTIDAVAIPRRPSPKLFGVPGALRAGVRQCRDLIARTEAVGIVTFGGYVSFPLDRAAKKAAVPLVIHEQNSVPGLTNRVAARWADAVALSFPGSAPRFPRPERCVVTGNPVRVDVLAVDRDAQRAAARAAFGLDPAKPTVLVFGGSQGARSLNAAVVAAHGRWGGRDVQVLHAAGTGGYSTAASAWQDARSAHPGGPRTELVDFIADMAAAYAAADVVVCRAGATSIAELTALGIPAVLVPYPHATADHQMENARALERTGGAVVIADDELDAASLVAAVAPLLDDDDAYARMARSSRAFGRRDAATNVARLLLDQIERAHHDPEGTP
jgi:UDP-N-acetylglucosamine--N-acetylmuramyl-(pentapeptide) pyrophosphoryl-undecaprenol N-acetylglucosamine transferase